MKKHILLFLLLVTTLFAFAQEKESASIYIDKKGIMRWSHTNEEASFFGVNYTVPFAHAYRALGYLNRDRKIAIDKDVYHFSRLGFNAYRIHIWDVEISDSKGNLLSNDHLDLLDYLIYKLKERNIKIVLTAMTNFGNGYPERNRNTGGFSYAYDKCDIHNNPEAIKIQQNYISQLVSHINPYTGKAYMNDSDIVGFEINNEPCHTGTQAQTQHYIKSMLASLRKAGSRKPVFYNVSHNMQQIEAYYSTDIRGTTYQWYPIGLVAGYTRQGNFLPYIDNYHIPFNKVKGFGNKAKLVYEYDPADVTYSYIHPAMVRAFRTAGFQWITQFAYDPMDMAWANTEYQTHFLNLAYTPQKAISMKIAAEAAYTLPLNKSYGVYPNDTLFAGFRVSYKEDLSEMNTPEKFMYSNHTSTIPVSAHRLKVIAGYGNSPIIRYEGTGAYFMDELEEGLWRLEIMPDAVQIQDPFAKPSLNKEVVTIMWNRWDMTIRLPQLQNNFTVKGINKDNNYSVETHDGIIRTISPGVYLLQRKGHTLSHTWDQNTYWNHIRLGEYVAPQAHATEYSVAHQPAAVIESGRPHVLEVKVAGPARPDSILVCTDKASYRNADSCVKMERVHDYTYRATIPADQIQKGKFRYNIVVCQAGNYYSFPAKATGSPLQWDYISEKYWETKVVGPDSSIPLFTATGNNNKIDAYTMPSWNYTPVEILDNAPAEEQTVRVTFLSDEDNPCFFLKSYVKPYLSNRTSRLQRSSFLCLHIKEAPPLMNVGFVTDMGYTYASPVKTDTGIIRVPLSELRQVPTTLLPRPYPTFLPLEFNQETFFPFQVKDIESLVIGLAGVKGVESIVEIGSIWLE